MTRHSTVRLPLALALTLGALVAAMLGRPETALFAAPWVVLLLLGLSSMGYAPRRLYQNQIALKVYYEKLERHELPLMEWEDLTPELEIMREVVARSILGR